MSSVFHRGRSLRRHRVLGVLVFVAMLPMSGCLFTGSTTDGHGDGPTDTGQDVAPDVTDAGETDVRVPDTRMDTRDATTDAGGDVDPGPAYPFFHRFNSGTTHKATGGNFELHVTVESGMTADQMTGGDYTLKLAPLPAAPTGQ